MSPHFVPFSRAVHKERTTGWSFSVSQHVLCFVDCHYVNDKHSLRDKMSGAVPCCILLYEKAPSTRHNPTNLHVPKTFNIQQFHVLPTQCISLFYMDLRTNSNYLPLYHSVTGFYNWEEMCFLRGTDRWVFKYNSGSYSSFKGWWKERSVSSSVMRCLPSFLPSFLQLAFTLPS